MEKLSGTKSVSFRIYILCDNFSKIRPIINKWGAKEGPQGVQI